MKNTWRHYLRRLAAVSVVSGSMAWSSAMCYAVQVANDNASDPVYANGWQEGDNGGIGFGPWSFDGTFTNNPTPGGPDLPDDGNQQAMDDGLKSGIQTSSPYNDLGRAWTMFNNKGKAVPPANGDVGTSISRAGRSMPALEVGQTLSVVLDNPIQRSFFRGYNLKLNTGANANGCYNGDNCTTTAYDPGSVVNAWKVETFDYFSYGQWQWFDPTYPLFDTDTDAGVRIDFTLTAANAYSFTMTPLDNTGLAVTRTGTLPNSDPVDWLEFQFYNTDSDFYPGLPAGPGDYNNDGKVDAADYVVWRDKEGTMSMLPNDPIGGTIGPDQYDQWRKNFGNAGQGVIPGAAATDFYIRSLEITGPAGSGLGSGAVPEPGTLVLLVVGSAGVVTIGLRRKPTNRRE